MTTKTTNILFAIILSLGLTTSGMATESSQPAQDSPKSEASKTSVSSLQTTAAGSSGAESGSRFLGDSGVGAGENVDPQSGALSLQQTDLAIPGRNGLNLSVSRYYNSKSFTSSPKWNSYGGTGWNEWDYSFNNMELNLPEVDSWGGWMGKGWQTSIGGELVVYSLYSRLWMERLFTNDLDNEDKQILAVAQFAGQSITFENKDLGSVAYPKDKSIVAHMVKTDRGYKIVIKGGITYYFQLKTYRKFFDYKAEIEQLLVDAAEVKKQLIVESYYLTKITDKNGNEMSIEYEVIPGSATFDNSKSDSKHDATFRIKINAVAVAAQNWLTAFLPIYSNTLHSYTSTLFYQAYRPKKLVDTLGREFSLTYKAETLTSGNNHDSMISKIDFLDNAGNFINVKYEYDQNDCLAKVEYPNGTNTQYQYSYKEGKGGVSPNSGWQDTGYLIEKVLYATGGYSQYSYNFYKPTQDATADTSDFQAPDPDDKEDVADAIRFSSFIVSTKKINGLDTHKWEYQYSNGQLYNSYADKHKSGRNWGFRKVVVKDPLSISNTSEYQDGLLIKQTNALGQYTQNTWDPTYKTLLSTTAYKGSKTYKSEYAYDEFLNPTIAIEYGDWNDIQDDRQIVHEYQHFYDNNIYSFSRPIHKWGQKPNKPNTKTNEIFYEIDSACTGNIKKIIQKLGATDVVTSFTYDRFGNVLSQTKPQGHTTFFSWYKNAYLNKTTDVVGSTKLETHNEYFDNTGLLKNQTGLNGLKVSYDYDNLGRLTKTTNESDQSNVQIAYDDINHKKTIRNAKGQETTTFYDNLGRVYKATAPDGGTTLINYNNVGIVDAVTGPGGDVVRYEYDQLYRKRFVYPIKDNNDIRTEIQYLDSLNAYKTIDAKGQSTTYFQDGFNNLAQITRADGFSTYYSYDIAGNLLSVKDPRGLVTTYSYDQLGRRTLATFSNSKTESYRYDANNNLISKTKRDGKVINFNFDDLDRLILIDYPEGTTDVSYSFDDTAHNALGKIWKINDAVGSTEFYYNQKGQPIKKNQTIDNIQYSTEYDYDVMGNFSWLKYPNSTNKISYQYDELQRVTNIACSIVPGSQQNMAGYLYNSDGTLQRIKYSNNTFIDYSYDAEKRVNTINGYKDPQQAAYDVPDFVFEHQFVYDNAGNRKSYTFRDNLTPIPRTITYNYDELNQLKEVNYFDGDHFIYTFDANGNRTYYKFAFGDHRYTYKTDSNQLDYYRDGSGKVKYSYDDNGNIIKKELIDSNQQTVKTVEYSFDQAGNLTRIHASDSPTDSVFAYNADGIRIKKVFGDETTLYHYGLSGEVILETDQAGNEKKRLISDFNGRIICAIKPGASRIEDLIFHYNDIVGSPVSLIQGNKIKQNYYFEPFGNIELAQGSIFDNAYQFTGQELDEEQADDLYYYGARYYDPLIGRFLSEDPAKQGINHYVYTLNNPLKYIDPDGQFFAEIFEFFGSAMGYPGLGTVVGGAVDSAIVAGGTSAGIDLAYQWVESGFNANEINWRQANQAFALGAMTSLTKGWGINFGDGPFFDALELGITYGINNAAYQYALGDDHVGSNFSDGFGRGVREHLTNLMIESFQPAWHQYDKSIDDIKKEINGAMTGYIIATPTGFGFEHWQIVPKVGEDFGILGKGNGLLGLLGLSPGIVQSIGALTKSNYRIVRALYGKIDQSLMNKVASYGYFFPINTCISGANKYH